MYRKTVLKNGVRIISEHLDYMRSVSLGIWVNAGSRDEDSSENGISHFIEHMSFKGTKSRNSFQIAKELDAIGGQSNAFTGKENTCFHGRVLGKHFKFFANILSDISLNSIFEPYDLELERQVILKEISMVEDMPDDNIHVLFNRLFWVDHPLGMPILGTGKTVSSIGRETIQRHINKFYVPERIIVVASGDVNHQSMVSLFKPFFEPISVGGDLNSERNAPHSKACVSIHFKDLEQVHICLGGECPSNTSESRFACAILNTILGGTMSSRLFQEVRENRGLAYSIYSFLSLYFDAGLFGIYVATDHNKVNSVLETIQTEIIKIRKCELNESDLSAAKEYLKGGIYLASESGDNRMMRIAKDEIIFGRYVTYEELVSRLESVTVDEVIEVARGIFREDRFSLVTLGPFKEEDLDRGTLLLS